MGLIHLTVKLRSLGSANGAYEAEFLVDPVATDSLVPASKLNAIGLQAGGKTTYELANGEVVGYEFGLVKIGFMDEVTAGRVIFGPENSEPILEPKLHLPSASRTRSLPRLCENHKVRTVIRRLGRGHAPA